VNVFDEMSLPDKKTSEDDGPGFTLHIMHLHLSHSYTTFSSIIKVLILVEVHKISSDLRQFPIPPASHKLVIGLSSGTIVRCLVGLVMGSKWRRRSTTNVTETKTICINAYSPLFYKVKQENKERARSAHLNSIKIQAATFSSNP
jgi:hypothetical protein